MNEDEVDHAHEMMATCLSACAQSLVSSNETERPFSGLVFAGDENRFTCPADGEGHDDEESVYTAADRVSGTLLQRMHERRRGSFVSEHRGYLTWPGEELPISMPPIFSRDGPAGLKMTNWSTRSGCGVWYTGKLPGPVVFTRTTGEWQALFHLP